MTSRGVGKGEQGGGRVSGEWKEVRLAVTRAPWHSLACSHSLTDGVKVERSAAWCKKRVKHVSTPARPAKCISLSVL